MTGRRLVFGSLVTAAAALLLFVFASSFDRTVWAQGQSQGGTLTGTWFNLPGGSGLTGFYTFNQDGTMAGTRSHEFGGPPRAGTFRSALRGVWRRAGNQYEVVSFGFNYDGSTGEAVGITRIRQLVQVEVGYDRATAAAFVTQ